MKKLIFSIAVIIGFVPAFIGFFVALITSCYKDGTDLHHSLYKWVTGKDIEEE